MAAEGRQGRKKGLLIVRRLLRPDVALVGEYADPTPGLAELQQDNFVDINPRTAAERSIRNGEYVWVSTPSGARLKVKAQVTERVGPDTCFIPFHFSGWWQGQDMLAWYPDGAAPIVRGEAVN